MARLQHEDASLHSRIRAVFPPPHIHYIFQVVVKLGLLRFQPDLRGDLTSYYNQVHRLLAVLTFQQAALHGAVSNPLDAADTTYLYRYYDNFIQAQKKLELELIGVQ
uniref:Uncharacterized protein n=1 Tax=Mycena chlorophos TaxID=658473 RepID=A0ABQ0KUX9_MYCCL|nr:predicted protein [Mycena chlorophos]